MRHVIVKGYRVGVQAIPADLGGGRLIQLAANDESELIEIALLDDDWEQVVELAQRVHVAQGGDVAKFAAHTFQRSARVGICGVCGL